MTPPDPQSGKDTTEQQAALGRALIAAGPMTSEFLEEQLTAAGKEQSVLGKALLASGYTEKADLFQVLTKTHRIPKVNIKNTRIPLETVRLLPEELAREHKVLPLDKIGSVLVIVTPNILDADMIEAVREETGCRLCLFQCQKKGFEEVVNEYYERLSTAVTASPSIQKRGPSKPTTPVKALPVDKSELTGTIPLKGSYYDPRADWDRIHGTKGPVKVIAAQL